MSLVITDECIACDACRDECPNEAISEGDPIYIINSNRCTHCVGHFDTPSCVEVCPVECIILDVNKQETQEELLNKYQKLMEEV